MADLNQTYHINRPSTTLRSLKRWRRLSGFAGLVLFSTFFMPAITVCSTPEVPAENFWEALTYGTISMDDLAFAFLVCLAPYLFGLLTFFVMLRSRSYCKKTEKSLGISVSILLGTAAAIVALGVILDIVQYGRSWVWGAGIFMVIVMFSLAFWLRSLRMGDGGFLCMRWYAAICCLLWLGYLFFGGVFSGDTHYGLWLSLISTILILVGTFQEAASRGKKSFRQILWCLLSIRLSQFALDGPRCFECGYLLLGLPHARCPECGTPFDPAEHGLPNNPLDIPVTNKPASKNT